METSSRADRDQDPEAPPGPSSFPGRDQAGTLEFDRLYAGDCLQLFTRVASGSIDLVFADPPFNIGYDYDIYDDRREADTYLEWTKSWGREVVRALKPDGAFWLAIGDEYAAELKILFHRELGLSLRSWVILYYTFVVHCTRKFSRSHAHLFYFVKDPKRFTFNDQDIRVPSARQLVYFDTRANPDGRLPDDTWILRPQDVEGGFDPLDDTWYVPRVCGTFKERAGWHGCQMPEQLLGRIIKSCSNPGDLVLDPFTGSGTTLTVAKKLDRQGCPASGEGVEHEVTGVRAGFDDPAEELLGHLAAMPAGSLLECPADPRDIPGVVERVE